MVSDNGPQFVSFESTDFCRSNEVSVNHYRVPPYHPASNGLAKCMVESFKQSMENSSNDGIPFHHRLAINA